jgi:hypothetical protein
MVHTLGRQYCMEWGRLSAMKLREHPPAYRTRHNIRYVPYHTYWHAALAIDTGFIDYQFYSNRISVRSKFPSTSIVHTISYFWWILAGKVKHDSKKIKAWYNFFNLPPFLTFCWREFAVLDKSRYDSWFGQRHVRIMRMVRKSIQHHLIDTIESCGILTGIAMGNDRWRNRSLMMTMMVDATMWTCQMTLMIATAWQWWWLRQHEVNGHQLNDDWDSVTANAEWWLWQGDGKCRRWRIEYREITIN